MVRPDKKQIEKLKKQDKEISSIRNKEKSVEKDESRLRHLIKPTPIEVDLKKLKNDFKKRKR